MWHSIPDLGTGLLLATLVAAGYAFGVSCLAARTPRLLQAARRAAFGTIALIGAAVLVLAYAFVTHDFRISYVARYSDRSMPIGYLVSALWGGQDGSILWWLFLLGAYSAACIHWLRDRYLTLQPYVIATLMSVVVFFCVLMIFAADPFATTAKDAVSDGQGLNPLLQNIYMIVHPPALYLGFVGCSIPFAFAVGALISGRLDNEWIVAVRKWMLFAWLFLSIGNALGMLWAYVELGWGGFWGWDPVENAALWPWLTATAFVHSTMIQERRNMFKLWNVFLISATFFLTIFGTFLTRSGVIASVHAFAKSDLGTYFLWYLGIIIALTVGLVIWRLPMLRSKSRIESPASREAAFVVNNWALFGATLFVGIATTFPMISEAILDRTVSVGPDFYNRWMTPIGLAIFFLMGLAPLLGWRKTSRSAFGKAFIAPCVVASVVAAAHLAAGRLLGLPAIVPGEPMLDGPIGSILRALGSVTPLITTSLAAFNVTVIIQEFWRGTSARKRSTGENALTAFFGLVSRARRRYGGYVVHLGITLMFLGFVGRAWSVHEETSMVPGGEFSIQGYKLRYEQPRAEMDPNKTMTFVDLRILDRGGRDRGVLSPARFEYRTHPNQPSSEVAVMHSFRDDLYVVLGSLAPQTGRAALQVHVNPLVSWIWAGVAVLVVGALISLWPVTSLRRVGVAGYARATAVVISAVSLALLLASLPTPGGASRQVVSPPESGHPVTMSE